MDALRWSPPGSAGSWSTEDEEARFRVAGDPAAIYCRISHVNDWRGALRSASAVTWRLGLIVARDQSFVGNNSGRRGSGSANGCDGACYWQRSARAVCSTSTDPTSACATPLT